MPRKHLSIFSAACLLLITLPSAAAWQRIDATPELVNELFADTPPDQRPQPACSGAPRAVFDDNGAVIGLEPYPTQFSFFVDHDETAGTSIDLLLFLNGGGACWNGATCLGSVLTPVSTYLPVFAESVPYLETASQDLLTDQAGNPTPDAGGILSRVNGANPLADATKIFVPYCTGDIHIGSSTHTYTYPLPDGTPVQWTIQHRGFDNLQVVLRWLQRERENNLWSIDRATIAGSSAGGYGAMINSPMIIDALGDKTRYALIIDSANGVLTDGFLNEALGESTDDSGVWQARQNIDDILQPLLDLNAQQLWPRVVEAVGDAFPHTRISQSTAAFDIVQTLFYLFAKKNDDGSYNPYGTPPSELEVALTAALEWSPQARLGMLANAFRLRNYRYYLAAGNPHMHLIDPLLIPFPTGNYFAEDSARGVLYADWLHDMLNNPRRRFGTDWRNLSCFPRCLAD